MQAKPSSTASGMYSRSGSLNTTIPIYALSTHPGMDPTGGEIFSRPAHPPLHSTPDGEAGLLHDARNLIGAIGLYCDLLSMPGVLNAEHRQYADELRLLGARSGSLIERLLQSARTQTGKSTSPAVGSAWDGEVSRCVEPLRGIDPLQDGPDARPSDPLPGVLCTTQPAPVSLRKVVERCAGLLSRVAGGRVIELNFGDAATIPVSVDEEALERILVNLVRNAAAALSASDRSGDREGNGGAGDSGMADGPGAVMQWAPDPTADETPGAIRIGVGFLVNRVNDPKPWPIRRVRLTVEDSGCGMTPQQLERLLCGTRAPSRGSHGIGFRVVRDLVASSGGDLRVMSAPGIGTRVQIEWPMSMLNQEDTDYSGFQPRSQATANRPADVPEGPAREHGSPSSSPAACGIQSLAEREAAPQPVALSDSRADSRSGKRRITVC